MGFLTRQHPKTAGLKVATGRRWFPIGIVRLLWAGVGFSLFFSSVYTMREMGI